MGRLFSKWYDTFMGPLEKKKFKAIRVHLLKRAEGKVLEIGSGTGINFPLYQSVESITAIEPSPYMVRKSMQKGNLAAVPIDIVQANAEQLPFEDDTFDTIVGTLVLCTIPNVDKAIQEMKRVCKPNGKILLFEHVRMKNPFLAWLQDWLTPFWKKICDGCCLNRETAQVLQRQGLKMIDLETFYNGLFITMELKN